MIQEFTTNIPKESTAGHLGVTSKALSMFNKAKESVASITRRTLSTECRKIFDEAAKRHCMVQQTSNFISKREVPSGM